MENERKQNKVQDKMEHNAPRKKRKTKLQVLFSMQFRKNGNR